MKYRTIVADPPWDYPEGWPVSERGYQAAMRQGIPNATRNFRTHPYPMMTAAEIHALPVDDLAEDEAHLLEISAPQP